MRYALCAFPLVGVVLGGLCLLWDTLARLLMLPGLLRGAGLCLLPVAVTGGIHLDGYADTCDALASHGDHARRQEILKDPHIGAFGVIWLCSYFAADLALWTALPGQADGAVWLSFCLSRTLSGLAVATFPLARNTGLAHTFSAAADQKRTAWVLTGLAVLLAAGMALLGWDGAAAALAGLGVFAWYRRMARKEFGGLSGDLAGWFLQAAELAMLAALCLVRYGEELL